MSRPRHTTAGIMLLPRAYSSSSCSRASLLPGAAWWCACAITGCRRAPRSGVRRYVPRLDAPQRSFSAAAAKAWSSGSRALVVMSSAQGQFKVAGKPPRRGSSQPQPQPPPSPPIERCVRDVAMKRSAGWPQHRLAVLVFRHPTSPLPSAGRPPPEPSTQPTTSSLTSAVGSAGVDVCCR